MRVTSIPKTLIRKADADSPFLDGPGSLAMKWLYRELGREKYMTFCNKFRGVGVWPSLRAYRYFRNQDLTQAYYDLLEAGEGPDRAIKAISKQFKLCLTTAYRIISGITPRDYSRRSRWEASSRELGNHLPGGLTKRMLAD